MKRTFLFLLAAVLLGTGLWSCDKKNTTTVEWVDLGLPSGLLWADRNVGAESPEDYGNHYAWGETKPKKAYHWDNYAYFKKTYQSVTKYCNNPEYGLNGFTDTLTNLEASDDAATVNLGGSARMPRDIEWQELMDNTTITWTTTSNGVNDLLLTAPNGRSIFLPAAGGRYSSSFDEAGVQGHYWSSTLSDNPHDALNFHFYTSLGQGMSDNLRTNGSSVRAVRAGQN